MRKKKRRGEQHVHLNENLAPEEKRGGERKGTSNLSLSKGGGKEKRAGKEAIHPSVCSKSSPAPVHRGKEKRGREEEKRRFPLPLLSGRGEKDGGMERRVIFYLLHFSSPKRGGKGEKKRSKREKNLSGGADFICLTCWEKKGRGGSIIRTLFSSMWCAPRAREKKETERRRKPYITDRVLISEAPSVLEEGGKRKRGKDSKKKKVVYFLLLYFQPVKEGGREGTRRGGVIELFNLTPFHISSPRAYLHDEGKERKKKGKEKFSGETIHLKPPFLFYNEKGKEKRGRRKIVPEKKKKAVYLFSRSRAVAAWGKGGEKKGKEGEHEGSRS